MRSCPARLASLRVAALLLASVTLACGRPIELVDEGVVSLEGELPFSLDALPDGAGDALRVSAELVGHGAEITLQVTEDGRLSGELAYALESESEVTLVVRASGALSAADERVLLAEHRRTVSLVPRGDASVTLAKKDFATQAETGVDAFRFDKNRNGRANLDDLLAGCAPGVPAPALVLSATDLQFPSGVAPGEFQRQVLVLDNLGERELEYWVRVVGAPGVLVSPLEVDVAEAPVPRLDLGDEEAPLVLAPGEEALVAVTFAPADSTLTTGFLVVESRDPCEVRQAGAVRLIGNADGRFAPLPTSFDPGDIPDPGALGLDEELPVSTTANLHLFDGRPLTLPALSPESPAVEIGGALARAAALLSLPPATRLGVGLVELVADADLYLFPIEGSALGTPLTSIHPGTDAETLVLEPSPEARQLLVVVSEAPVEGAARRVESYSLFFRASSVPTFTDPALSPRVGPVDGGTAVTLFGAGFRPGAQVFFAGAPASDVVVDPSGTSLTAVTPPGTLLSAYNPATVVVRNPPEGGTEPQTATLPTAFVYAPSPPTIIALDPTSAVVGVDRLVTIRGAGFTDFFGPLEVDFGGVPSSSVSFLSSTELLVLAPASNTPGAVEVKVRLQGPKPDDPIEASAPAAFTWVEPLPEPPSVSGISPASGAAGNPVAITVAGSGFVTGARVFFEPLSGASVAPVSASSVTVVDEGELVAVTPPLVAGDWAVVVENPDEQRAADRPTFRAYAEAGADPFASAVTPEVVHAEVAGDTLSVLGANLSARALVGVSIEGDGQTFAASLTSIVDAIAAVRVDAPLSPGEGYRVLFDYGDVVVRSPPFSAEAPALFAAQVLGAPAIEGRPFTLLLTGQRLFPTKLEGVRFDGPISVMVAPSSKTESNVRVDVPSLVQGTYAATLVYAGGFEAELATALYIDGECGDGAKSALEQCDGADLGGATCASEGFVGGVLSCNADCTLNTSLCDGCGNGVLEAGEECDGDDFGAASCEALGFTGGALSCHAATCSVVVSSCTLCGDGIAEEGEACDGSDVRGQSCTAFGFTGGTLACRDDCSALDVLGCQTCGDGVCSGSETNASCPADCAPTCGNDTCDVGEDCASCPLDCATCGPFHALVVAGGSQSAYIGQALASPLRLRVEDASGAPVAGAVLAFHAPPGGKVVATSGTTAVTDAAGEVFVTVTLGFTVGTQSVVVTGIGPGGAPIEELPLTIDFSANDVPAGTIYTLVNRFGASGNPLDEDGSSALSRLNIPRGIALDENGSLYIADRGNNRVLRVSPAGEIAHLAGDGGSDHDGELVDALTAGLHQPEAVLPDDDGGFYVAVSAGGAPGRIRYVDAEGIIRTFAGTSTPFPQRGDGLPAVDAYLGDPLGLAWHPSGDLIVVDAAAGGQHVRRFASDTTTTSTLLAASNVCELDGKTTEVSRVHAAVFEGSTLYFTTDGVPQNQNQVNACAPAQAQVGGQREGGTPYAIPGTGAANTLAIDAAGNLYLWSQARREIVRVDRYGHVTAVAGNGTDGNAGDYGDALSASFRRPSSLLMSPAGDLYISDELSHSVRVIRGVGRTSEPALTFSLVSTPPFSAPRMRATQPIVMRAAVDGAPIAGLRVIFELLNGHKLLPLSAQTDVFGEASTVMWAGFVEDDYAFRATVLDRLRAPLPGASLDVVVTGHGYPTGTLVPVVNPSDTNGSTLSGSAFDTELHHPSDVLALPGGALLVCDRQNHRVIKVNPNGTTEVIAGNGTANGFPVNGAAARGQPFPSPRALARNDAGEIFVSVITSSQGRVYKIDAQGRAVHLAGGGGLVADGVIATAASLTEVLSLAYDDDTDTLFLTEDTAIRRVASDGYIYRVPFATTCPPSQVLEMNRVEVLGGNHIAVGVSLNGCGGFTQFRVLLDVDVATGALSELSDGNLVPMDRNASSANAVAVSPVSGLLYFDTRYEIYRRESDGTFTSITGTAGTLGHTGEPVTAGPGGLVTDPSSFTFDELGNLYFTELNKHTIRMIANPDAL